MTDTKQRGYWREYEWRRRTEALTARERTRLLQQAVRRAAPEFAAAGTTPGRPEAGVMILPDGAGGGSYRGMASRLAGSAGLRRRYGLTYELSKSTLHAAAALARQSGACVRMPEGGFAGFYDGRTDPPEQDDKLPCRAPCQKRPPGFTTMVSWKGNSPPWQPWSRRWAS